MKKLYSFKSFNSNPSALGADRLWLNVKICREDVVHDKDYDGI